jgi:hypothetical protein
MDRLMESIQTSETRSADKESALTDTLKSPARHFQTSSPKQPSGMRSWSIDLMLFAGMLVVFAVLAELFHISFLQASRQPHFIAQAQALLNGRLDVTGLVGWDYVTVHGESFLVYPPFPALLMLPFVAVLGSHFSDVWFTWLAGAANVVLTYRLLEAMRTRGWTTRTWRENAIIATVFGVGTIALWLALGGQVWFTAQTLAITGLLVMLYGAVAQRWWLASLGVGIALLTRSPDVLGGLFVLVAFLRAHGIGVPNGNTAGALWQRFRWIPERLPSVGSLVGLAVPFLIAFGIFVARNKLFFGSFLDTGYGLQIQQHYPQIRYGLLSWHYIWPNFVADFLNLPTFQFTTPYDPVPKLDLYLNGNGSSIFFTTPIFLLFFTNPGRVSQPWVRATLWVVVAILVMFTLLWNLTGWVQVGARYLFDVYPFLIMLLAMRAEKISRFWLALAGAGVVVNIALSSTFWCNRSLCLGHPSSGRHLIFGLLLLAVPFAGWMAWRWLQQERIAQKPDA